MQRQQPHAAVAAPALRVTGLAKRYAADAPAALSGVSFDVDEGELLAVVGSSGCGKTTLLRLLCGLTPASEGTVLFDGRPVVRPPREFALVFQDYSRSLFPWLTVIGNVLSRCALRRGARGEAGAEPRQFWRKSASRAWHTPIRGSSRAGCSSVSPSHVRSSLARVSCSSTSRSHPSTRSPARTSRICCSTFSRR